MFHILTNVGRNFKLLKSWMGLHVKLYSQENAEKFKFFPRLNK